MSIDFETPVSADDIEKLFNIVLKRAVGNERWKMERVERSVPFGKQLSNLVSSDEHRDNIIRAAGAVRPAPELVDDYKYRLPSALQAVKTEPKKIALIGSCLLDSWVAPIKKNFPDLMLERVTFYNASKIPDISKEDAATYDFQVVQVPLRSILPESSYLNLQATDLAGHQKLFDDVCERMQHSLDAVMQYNEHFGMLSFVLNFALPQQNSMGRLTPRYTLSNMVYFVEELNRKLYEYVSLRKNSHIVDVDQISSMYGRKYFQDDSITHYNHGSNLRLSLGGESDRGRLEPIGNISKIYASAPDKFALTVWHEVLSHYRTIQQAGSIKLVIFDLDDTLWSGLAAERGYALVEGWPMGMLEAVSYLWKRGILVAIVSKNDEAPVRKIWERAFRFSLENFVSIRINWLPKPDNIAEILRETNLLPNSVLFVDDNPVERAAVRAAFPEIRVLDLPLAHWRRTLLWSSELQRAGITDEAVARTEMVQNQRRREEFRVTVSHEDFLASLETTIHASKLADSSDKIFARCFELLNKTNQFNTTGKRWTQAEIESFFTVGGYFIALDVTDSFTSYGIVGLVLIRGNVIEQFVLSCRTFGMRIEDAAIAIAQRHAGNNISGKIKLTDKNRLSMELYQSLGFTQSEPGLWVNAGEELGVPPQITLKAA